MAESLNTRILVIDDDEAVRDSFLTILWRRMDDDDAVVAAASALFDRQSPKASGLAPGRPRPTHRYGRVVE